MTTLEISREEKTPTKDSPADMCSEILIRILRRPPFYPNVLVNENLTDQHNKIVDIAEQQLQCPRVDLKYQDPNGITVEEYAAIWNSSRLNEAMEKHRKKRLYLHGLIPFFISEPGTRFLSDLYDERWSPRDNFKPLNKSIDITYKNKGIHIVATIKMSLYAPGQQAGIWIFSKKNFYSKSLKASGKGWVKFVAEITSSGKWFIIQAIQTQEATGKRPYHIDPIVTGKMDLKNVTTSNLTIELILDIDSNGFVTNTFKTLIPQSDKAIAMKRGQAFWTRKERKFCMECFNHETFRRKNEQQCNKCRETAGKLGVPVQWNASPPSKGWKGRPIDKTVDASPIAKLPFVQDEPLLITIGADGGKNHEKSYPSCAANWRITLHNQGEEH